MEMGSLNKTGGGPPKAVQPTEQSVTRQRLAEMADRELAAEKSGDHRQTVGTAVQAEKLDDIRRKIETGYYNREDIRKMIADRLSADLDAKE